MYILWKMQYVLCPTEIMGFVHLCPCDHNGNLITEQGTGEQNPLFQLEVEHIAFSTEYTLSTTIAILI